MNTLLAGAAGRSSGTLRAAVAAMLLGLVALGLAFRAEAVAAVSVWSASTAYTHCFLVLPIAAWLAYDRRHKLPFVVMRPLPWAVLLGVPLGMAWLLSDRMGIMEGRQLAALGFIELLALSVLGWRFVKTLRAPLLYLVFLVPFGSFLTASLQDFTARAVVFGLDHLGIPNFADGHTIEIPEGVFYVAEACAGLRFLIASIAFGVLYAFTLYRSPGRRILFVAVSVVVPVLANAVRALGIVVAGHLIGSAQAAAADHLIYGWVFFSVIIVLLILAGLPFRQDRDASPRLAIPDDPPPPASRMVLPVLLLAALAAAWPLLADQLDAAAAAESVAAPTLPLAGCVPARFVAINPASPALLARTGAAAASFLCQDGTLQLRLIAFPPRTDPMPILLAERAETGQEQADEIERTALPQAGVPGWDRVSTIRPDRLIATSLWIDGNPASPGLRFRFLQARHSLFGARHPVLLAVAHAVGEAALATALHDANAAGLSRQLAALSGHAQ